MSDIHTLSGAYALDAVDDIERVAFARHLTECPACAGRLRKLYSSVGIVFKGSGFYRTDSRAKTGEAKESSKSETKSESKSETKTDSTKSESKPAASSKPAAAPAA